MNSNQLRGVYLITDTSIQNRFSHLELVEQALEAGVQMIQYRDKHASAREAIEQIREISQKTSDTSTTFIVNDRTDLALSESANGVHLGQDDLPIPVARQLLGKNKVIGGTSSTLEEALQVEQAGADYVALGHIFATGTKHKSYPPRGGDMLGKAADALLIPLVAIGGITLETAPQVVDAGADIIALSSAICASDDPEEEARKFVELFD